MNGWKRDLIVLFIGLAFGGLTSTAGYLHAASNKLTRLDADICTINDKLDNLKTPPIWFERLVRDHVEDKEIH